MKLTNVLLILLVTAMALIYFELRTHRTPFAPPQYELYNGRYQAISGNQSVEQSTVFKIEKTTGRSWRWLEIADNGMYTKGWEELKNLS